MCMSQKSAAAAAVIVVHFQASQIMPILEMKKLKFWLLKQKGHPAYTWPQSAFLPTTKSIWPQMEPLLSQQGTLWVSRGQFSQQRGRNSHLHPWLKLLTLDKLLLRHLSWLSLKHGWGHQLWMVSRSEWETKTSVGKDVELLDHSDIAGGNARWCSHIGKLVVLQKLKHGTNTWPSYSTSLAFSISHRWIIKELLLDKKDTRHLC